LAFGGTEKTYQSWNGLEDLDLLKNDRTFNTAGMYTDASEIIVFMIMKPIITNKIINCIGMKKYQRTGGLI
jgi:hypothetical protein